MASSREELYEAALDATQASWWPTPCWPLPWPAIPTAASSAPWPPGQAHTTVDPATILPTTPPHPPQPPRLASSPAPAPPQEYLDLQEALGAALRAGFLSLAQARAAARLRACHALACMPPCVCSDPAPAPTIPRCQLTARAAAALPCLPPLPPGTLLARGGPRVCAAVPRAHAGQRHAARGRCARARPRPAPAVVRMGGTC